MRTRQNNRRNQVNRIIPIPREYLDAIAHGKEVFNPLFQFENALRLVVEKHMQTCYGPNWWNLKIQIDLPKTYDYVEKVKRKEMGMPWIGGSSTVPIIPLHSITLGQLEEIVKHYKADCFPQLFPSEVFFFGHMEVIKKVRNLFAHMHPCIDKRDVKIAKREIATMCDHLRTKL
jgi:hypothetical protein